MMTQAVVLADIDGILRLSDQAYQDMLDMVAGLTDDQREDRGTLLHWPAKVVMAHCSTWKVLGAQVLTAIARKERAPFSVHLGPFNERVFEDNRDRPWADILSEAHQAQEVFVAAVRALPEPALLPGGRRNRLLRLGLHYGYEHPESHIAQYWSEHHDIARAEQTSIRLSEVMTQLGEAWTRQGSARCRSASGQRPRRTAESLGPT